jgi:outer membrane protein
MKHIRAILLLAAALTMAGTPAHAAQTNAVKSLTLDQCITEALQHNFDVQVQRFAPEISLDNLYGAYGGWDPVLSASGEHDKNVSASGLAPVVTTNGLILTTNLISLPSLATDANRFNSDIKGTLPWGLQYDFSGNIAETYGPAFQGGSLVNADSTAGNIGVNLAQPLLKNFWIDTTREQITLAKAKFKSSEQGVRLQLMTTVAAVENAYYELGYAYENVTVQQEALNLASQQLSDDEQRVRIQVLAEHGGTIEQDEAQVAQSRASLIAAQFTLQQDQNTLKNLITDQYADWHDVDIMPADKMAAIRQLFDVQDSWGQGMTLRPDLLQARLNVEEQGIVIKFDRNQLYPELDLIGSYGYNGASREFSGTLAQIRTGNAPFYSYGAQITMPLANVGARNTYKADKSQKALLLLQLKQLEQSIMVQIDNDVKQAESAWESVDATREQRIYAEVALSAEQQKYAVGKSTTFTVLQLQNNVTSARSAEIRSLANYNEALTQLTQQEGSILKQRNLDIEVK